MTTPDGALREVRVTKAVGDIDCEGDDRPTENGFVKILNCHVTKGVYAERLVRSWNDFDAAVENGSENRTPERFEEEQKYLVVVLSDGGTDLEHFGVSSWEQAASILWQVVTSLATAEEQKQFEHRDLHWGNVLVRSTPHTAQDQHSIATLSQPSATGVEAIIIDFTLSRINVGPKQNVYEQLSDEQLFGGTGDMQFDVYRQMRDATQSDWEGFYPITNALWLRYLVDKLLHAKGLKEPVVSGRRKAHAAESFAYNSLRDAQQQLASVKPDDCGCTSAKELLHWAVSRNSSSK
ncbi:hypothetical protein K437DRAFT_224973 [Tilletiaria anomala UBC 951]|uniref:non-specific serine/threonine protein kinase n=1 Tax=Tilletiaria anomala (strain ATCC 24038 / CBS 436.72 / UBC 951) TaxID=1037660 RepID=A0A066VVT8_TILAU|nr:uncharacterized protein K437DRAFT_224973 [Tilletiaria anomala UBC 951]KDN44373.1 hypothetical protein K437DRAFT_224973 [Tilletiaria anomala UBC 951]